MLKTFQEIEHEINQRVGWAAIQCCPDSLLIKVTDAESTLLNHLKYKSPEKAHAACGMYDDIITEVSFQSKPIPFQLDMLNRHAVALSLLYDITMDKTILEKRIAVLQRLIDRAPQDWPDTCNYTFNLASVFQDKFKRDGNLEFYNRFLDLLKQTLTTVKPKHRNYGLFHRYCAHSLYENYLAVGNIKYLDEAIILAENLLAESITTNRSQYLTQTALCNYYRHKFMRHKKPEDIDTSIEYGQKAIENASLGQIEEECAISMSNLGNALLEKAHTPNESILYRQAMALQLKAIRLSGKNNPLLCVRYNNLGNCLSFKFSKTRKILDLSKAIHYYNKAIETTPAGDQALSTRHYNVAIQFGKRYYQQSAREDFLLAKKHYKIACELALMEFREWALFASLKWGNLLVAEQNFEEAVEAFNYGFKAINLLYEQQFRTSDKNTWLSEARMLTTQLAWMQLECGRELEAITTLEQGLARNFREGLMLQEAKMLQLKSSHPDIFTTYIKKEDLVRQLAASNGNISILEKARNSLRETLTAIRNLPGFEHFHELPNKEIVERVLLNSADKTIVYMLATGNSISFLVAQQGLPGGILRIEIPIAASKLKKSLETHYINFLQTDNPKFQEALSQLWPYLQSSIRDTLARCQLKSHCILILTGFFDLLPIHSLFPDNIDVTVVPSLLSHNEMTNRHSSALFRTESTALCIANAQPDNLPLEFTALEIEAINHCFDNVILLDKKKACKKNFSNNLATAEYIHFATHSYFNWKKPLKSGIQFADSILTLKELFEDGYNMDHIRLVSMASCQSGINDIDRLPDEAISLPAAFLQAGAQGVVSTLWSVSDISTSLLMRKFYDNHLQKQMPPVRALRTAQMWLANATNKELDTAEIYENTWKETNEKHFAQLALYSRRNPLTAPFSCPYYWAGFYYTGV